MHAIVFSRARQRMAEFHAEAMSFERQPEGLVVDAQGEMTFQDTPLLEQYLAETRTCNVCIAEGEEPVIDDRFEVIFFTCELNHLIFRLS